MSCERKTRHMKLIFWGALVIGNVAAFLLYTLDRCGCGAPEFGKMLYGFGLSAGLVAGAFTAFILPVAILWWAAARRWSVWRPLSVPKMILAGALLGSCAGGFLDYKLGKDEAARLASAEAVR
jgi:hypothetical protein